ncbi:MAG: hypothetical protein KAV00_10165 [Phycisphaerae bacterium]|nr:hypothetical protein [Phycisphaerae bacterium]
MNDKNEIPQDIITVSEMARRVGLSRARFYELMREGCFPEPSRNPRTNRPFFNRDQQKRCLQVRKTHCGINGQAVMFYGRCPDGVTPPKRPRPTSAPRSKRAHEKRDEAVLTRLRTGLAQLGITSASDADIRCALADGFPDGHHDADLATMLKAVFDRLNCRDAPDNVTG